MEQQAPAVRRPDLLAILPARLFIAERPVTYVATALATALIPSLLLSLLVSNLMPAQGPTFPKLDPWWLLFNLVVFAPVIETLIMGSVLLLASRFLGFLTAVLLSALGWAIAHSLVAPAWGLVIWWPFLIFSLSFLVWRERSLLHAFAIPATVHALQNLGPALLLVSGNS